MLNLLKWILKHKNIAVKAIYGLFVGLLLFCSTLLYKQNKRLSESLELAQNNVEVYQGIANGANEQNGVLKLTVDQLKQANDSLLNEMAVKANKNSIKLANVNTAATQHQSILVNGAKGVGGDTIYIYNDTGTHSDSIRFNDLTVVYYNISKDTVDISLQLDNTQYLYTFKHKEWKNKKNFLKRLFTLDFKKVWKYTYQIINTNDLINTSDVRVVELND